MIVLIAIRPYPQQPEIGRGRYESGQGSWGGADMSYYHEPKRQSKDLIYRNISKIGLATQRKLPILTFLIFIWCVKICPRFG